MKNIITTCILAFCCSALIISCSKESNENIDQQTKKYRLTTIDYDDGFMENYYYNEKGQLRKISDSDGDFEEFIYDENNKLVKSVTDHGEIEFSYDGERLSQIGDLIFEYNDQNLIIKLISDNAAYSLKYDNQGRLVMKVRIEVDITSPVYDSTIYKWSQDGNLLEKKEVNNHWYDIANDYRRYLDQENYEYGSYINPYSTIGLPDEYKLLKLFLNDLDESFSKNNVVEIRQTHSEEYANNGGNNQFSTITYLFNVTENEDNLPKRIEGEYASWNLTYEPI